MHRADPIANRLASDPIIDADQDRRVEGQQRVGHRESITARMVLVCARKLQVPFAIDGEQEQK